MILLSFKKKNLINKILIINYSSYESNNLLRYQIKLFSQHEIPDKKSKNLLLLANLENVAQSSIFFLRRIIELNSRNCRFFFHCNQIHKKLVPIASRCLKIIPLDPSVSYLIEDIKKRTIEFELILYPGTTNQIIQYTNSIITKQKSLNRHSILISNIITKKNFLQYHKIVWIYLLKRLYDLSIYKKIQLQFNYLLEINYNFRDKKKIICEIFFNKKFSDSHFIKSLEDYCLLISENFLPHLKRLYVYGKLYTNLRLTII